MAYLNSFPRQQKIFIGVSAALSSFVLGAMVPLVSYLIEEMPVPTLPSAGETTVSEALPDIKVAVTQRMGGFTSTVEQIEKKQLQSLNFSVPARFQGSTIYDIKLSGNKKVVALTFDDGPWPDTGPVLDILKKNKVKATFFWIGRHLQNYPELARRVVAEGHAVGNHTWNHKYNQMDRERAAKEIEDTAALIYKLTGRKTSLFRPPGGMLNNGLAAYAKSQKMAVAMWSVDTHESRGPGADQILNTVLKNAKSGGVVLMHDGGADRTETLKALPDIISELRQRGYQFVTLPQLLAMADKELQTPAPVKPAPVKPAPVKPAPKSPASKTVPKS